MSAKVNNSPAPKTHERVLIINSVSVFVCCVIIYRWRTDEMLTRVKFCGLTRISDIEAVNELKPEYIGFVFWQKSKRNIIPDEAKKLKDMLNESTKAVGVFVDEDIEVIKKISDEDIIDVIQLHGKENEEYIKSIKRVTGKTVIKAFKINSDKDIIKANTSIADYVLLDAGMGQGKTFDWKLIKGMKRPYFLAGGLDLNNVEDAVINLEPFAVDVSSGIETEGKKDYEKMKSFLDIVRCDQS